MNAAKIGSIMLMVCCFSACHQHEYRQDQKLRNQIFERCLERIPEGPRQTQYNDWAEVVSECESAAYFQSKLQVCHHPQDSLRTIEQ